MNNPNNVELALTCNAFPPIPMEKNTMYNIGRDNNNSIVLVDDLVSRNHAAIIIDLSGTPFIEDRGSRNGTLLNGTRIHQRTILKENDKVTVGTYQIFIKNLNTNQDPIPEELSSTTMALGDLGGPEGMVGTLSHINITELFTTLEYNEKTGMLAIATGMDEAKIYFYHGNCIKAEFQDLVNLEAVFKVLSLTEGTFEFQNQDLEGIPTQIPLTTQQIFLEYARYLENNQS